MRPTPTDLIHLCLTTPRTPQPIKDMANALKRSSKPGPQRNYTDTEAAKVLARINAGESLRSISRVTGMPFSTVRRIKERGAE